MPGLAETLLGFEPAVTRSRSISNLRLRSLSQALRGLNANFVLQFKSGQEEGCLLPANAGAPQLFLVLASGCSRHPWQQGGKNRLQCTGLLAVARFSFFS